MIHNYCKVTSMERSGPLGFYAKESYAFNLHLDFGEMIKMIREIKGRKVIHTLTKQQWISTFTCMGIFI